MTYEEAKKIALAHNSRFNACREFEKGYHFFERTKDEITGDFGAVILKSNGRTLSWINFLHQYHPERNPKKISF